MPEKKSNKQRKPLLSLLKKIPLASYRKEDRPNLAKKRKLMLVKKILETQKGKK